MLTHVKNVSLPVIHVSLYLLASLAKFLTNSLKSNASLNVQISTMVMQDNVSAVANLV